MKIKNINVLTKFLNEKLKEEIIENISGGYDTLDDRDAERYFILSLRDYDACNGCLELGSYDTKSGNPELINYDEEYFEDDSVEYTF